MKKNKFFCIAASLLLCTGVQAQQLQAPGGLSGIGPSPATIPQHIIATGSTTNGGIFKVQNTLGSTNDRFWIGFSHGTNTNHTTDAYDRARVGVEIIPGGAGRLFFTTGFQHFQTERMRIDHVGNVGIGTITPARRLHVNGDVQLDNLTSGTVPPGSASLLTLSSTNEVVSAPVTSSTLLPGATSILTLKSNAVVSSPVSNGAFVPGNKILTLDGSNNIIAALFSGWGTGTPNYLPKWNPSGTAFTTTSNVYDDGTTVGVGTTTPDHSAAMNVVQGPGKTTGIISEATNVGGQNINIAVEGIAANGTASNTAIRGEATGGSQAKGGYFSASCNTNTWGIESRATGLSAGPSTNCWAGWFNATGASVNKGIAATASGSTNLLNIGVDAWAESSSDAGTNYGVKAHATSVGTTTVNYGVHATIFGGAPAPDPFMTPPMVSGASYAGYFGDYTAGGWGAAFFNGDVIGAGNGFFSISDRKFKENIAPLENVMDKIMQLSPSSYTFKGKNEFPSFNFPKGKQLGLIAQELEEVFPELVKAKVNPAQYDAKGNQIAEAVAFKGVMYTELIPVLIKGMQEQQQMIQELKAQVAQLQAANNNNNNGTTSTDNVLLDGVRLYQNTPNPFSHTTEIKYYLPETIKQAYIAIYDLNGRKLRSYDLTQRGEGSVTVNSEDLAAGMYLYSLVVEGREADTKRMVLGE